MKKMYRYYYRPNGDIDFKYNFVVNQLNRMHYINNLPYIESATDYNISNYRVDVNNGVIVPR